MSNFDKIYSYIIFEDENSQVEIRFPLSEVRLESDFEIDVDNILIFVRDASGELIESITETYYIDFLFSVCKNLCKGKTTIEDGKKILNDAMYPNTTIARNATVVDIIVDNREFINQAAKFFKKSEIYKSKKH